MHSYFAARPRRSEMMGIIARLVSGVLVVMMALPSVAFADPPPADVGSVSVAFVSARELKPGATCDSDYIADVGDLDWDSGGLGTPALHPSGKTGYWVMDTYVPVGNEPPALHSLSRGWGSLHMCGKFKPQALTGWGAACYAHDAEDGHGYLQFFSHSGAAPYTGLGPLDLVTSSKPQQADFIKLRNVGWSPTAAGSLIPLTADVVDPSTGTPTGTFMALLSTAYNLACLEKRPHNHPNGHYYGHSSSWAQGVYAIQELSHP